MKKRQKYSKKNIKYLFIIIIYPKVFYNNSCLIKNNFIF